MGKTHTLTILLILSPIFVNIVHATNSDFDFYPNLLDHDLRPLATYQDKVEIISWNYQIVNVSFVCSVDQSCEWATLADGTKRMLSYETVLLKNDTVSIYLEVTLPDKFEPKQHIFYVQIKTNNQTTKIPYTITPPYEPNLVEKIIVWWDSTCQSFHIELPNKQFFAIDCVTLIVVLIVVIVIIISIGLIKWGRR